MATPRSHPPDPAAQQAKRAVRGAINRSKKRLGEEYPQLRAGRRGTRRQLQG